MDILYAPDFVINAGGLINVADELMGYDRDRAMTKVEAIYRTLREVFQRARLEGITPSEAAGRLAEDRIASVSRVRLLWVPGQARSRGGRD
jgi:leucine dehydrogenase